MSVPESLKPEKLRLKIDPEGLGFNSIGEFNKGEGVIIAQERAKKALEFGLRMRHPDFNVYVAGVQETGLSDLAISYIGRVARQESRDLFDWVYLYNFKDPDSPLAVSLKQGQARELERDMQELVSDLRLLIPQGFEGETYVARKEEVIRQFNAQRNKVFEELDKRAQEEGFVLQADQSGMMIIPAKEGRVPMTPDDISKLSKEEQEALKAKTDTLQQEMAVAMRRIHKLEQKVQQDLKSLDREIAAQTVQSLLEPMREKYGENERILRYLEAVGEDVVSNLDSFRAKPQAGPMPFPFPGSEPSFTQYEVNVLVDNSETQGVPVIVEGNPSYPNLFGTIERKAQFGALFTDFTMIKPGALHRANGGYLVVKATDLLKRPFSYEALKRALKEKELEVEDLGEQFGMFSTKALKPQAIPLDIKIVILGDPYLYHLLYTYDEDFRELFKVKAHMDVEVERDQERLEQFFRALGTFVKEEGLRDVDKSGVARLIEYSAELAGSQEKLSLKVADMADLLREAEFWAMEEGSGLITGDHVQKAIDEKAFRSRLYEDKVQEMLRKEIIKVATDGEVVGQVNGLAIYDMGDYMFGKPARITANISLGKEGVVNIEREADLSGNIHTKGMMILSGYLRSRFSSDRPLSLTASICFEQSYGMIDGDSASGAELFCLLSALSGLPIRQGRAVTGAVSQKGEILPIGGVTRKIEGFFDLCKARGLTGDQGVVIPQANLRDLMLRQEILDEVARGRFNIWAISRVEEGIELLTGVPAGERQEDGSYPPGSVFGKVDARLGELAEEARRFMQEEGEGESAEEARPDGGGGE